MLPAANKGIQPDVKIDLSKDGWLEHIYCSPL